MQNRNRDFWSEVQRTKKCSSRMAGTVDGCSNPNTTANVFADKYEDLSVEPPGGEGEEASPLWVDVRKLCNMCVLSLS